MYDNQIIVLTNHSWCITFCVCKLEIRNTYMGGYFRGMWSVVALNSMSFGVTSGFKSWLSCGCTCDLIWQVPWNFSWCECPLGKMKTQNFETFEWNNLSYLAHHWTFDKGSINCRCYWINMCWEAMWYSWWPYKSRFEPWAHHLLVSSWIVYSQP